jgi:serine protease AprX
VASIAAGDGTGIDHFAARYRGVAPGALLFGAKVLDSNGQGSSDAVAAGIYWCADQPEVDVINLSLGTSGSCDGKDLISRTIRCRR